MSGSLVKFTPNVTLGSNWNSCTKSKICYNSSLQSTYAPCKINIGEIKRNLNLSDTDVYLIIDGEEFLVDQLLKDAKELKRLKISNIVHDSTVNVRYFGTCLVDLIINYL